MKRHGLDERTGDAAHGRSRHALKARKLGLTAKPGEAIAVMPEDCFVCRSEGLTARTSIMVEAGSAKTAARLLRSNNGLVVEGEIGLSDEAWTKLSLKEGDVVEVRHPQPVPSFNVLRKRVYGNRLERSDFTGIVSDLVAGRYSDVHLASFVTACSAFPLDLQEMIGLTHSMVDAGKRLS